MFYWTHFGKHWTISFSLQFCNLVTKAVASVTWLVSSTEIFYVNFSACACIFIEHPEVVVVKIFYKSLISVATLFSSYPSAFALFL